MLGPGRSTSPATHPRTCQGTRSVHAFIIRSSDSRITVSALVVAVADIVDSDPHREERIAARPWSKCGLARRLSHELVHLVDQRKHCWLVRLDERGVDRGATVGVVVSQDERLVVYRGVDIDPVRAPDGSVALARLSAYIPWHARCQLTG